MVVRTLNGTECEITNAPLRAGTPRRRCVASCCWLTCAQSSLKAGDHARLIVQLRDGDNADLREPRVSIELRPTPGQFVPAALGLVVNGQPMPSSGRVTALTDSSGRANFDVSSIQQRQDPIVFRAPCLMAVKVSARSRCSGGDRCPDSGRWL